MTLHLIIVQNKYRDYLQGSQHALEKAVSFKC